MADDPMSVNYIRDLHVAADPYRFFESLRTRCPVVREPHHEVATVSGWQAAVDVYNDAETFSSCITVSPGPFLGFPVPLRREDTLLPSSQRIATRFHSATKLPPVRTSHRALLMRLITPKRLRENANAM
ncbi:cytochrome P450 [Mycolicibacterium sp. BK556]|nr:cytochrome P450 [Mycolicibacterium sp. BK556]MBB3636157.1 cytochrome P450 [Mycolicibacterium sp. BK607]